MSYRLNTPPSSDAFKHSGGDSLLCTSATVTLYLDVLDNKLRRPGTEQNTSLGEPIPKFPGSLPLFIAAKRKKKPFIQFYNGIIKGVIITPFVIKC